jgi:hypothetical protein
MATEKTQIHDIELAVQPAPAARRDALGQFCFVVHFLPLIYVVTGWLAPWRAALIVYLVFVPGMFLQWRLNRDSCVLNNMESLIRTGRWRNPANREEGAWLRTLVNGRTGWDVSRRQMDTFINAVLALFWTLALAHLQHWL